MALPPKRTSCLWIYHKNSRRVSPNSFRVPQSIAREIRKLLPRWNCVLDRGPEWVWYLSGNSKKIADIQLVQVQTLTEISWEQVSPEGSPVLSTSVWIWDTMRTITHALNWDLCFLFLSESQSAARHEKMWKWSNLFSL